MELLKYYNWCRWTSSNITQLYCDHHHNNNHDNVDDNNNGGGGEDYGDNAADDDGDNELRWSAYAAANPVSAGRPLTASDQSVWAVSNG